MRALELINKYYRDREPARDILMIHSRQVARLAGDIARRQWEQSVAVDVGFVEEAAWLHDIGIFRTSAPEIGCHGSAPYLTHGIFGARILQAEGLPQHALVCERHIGVGLSVDDIRGQKLPLPLRDMRPGTVEEEIVAYADLFFSKHRDHQRSPDDVRQALRRHGAAKVAIFEAWHGRFSL